MANGMVGGLAAVAAGGVVALLLRRAQPDDSTVQRPSSPERPLHDDHDEDDEQDGDASDDEREGEVEGEDEGHVIAVTSDGEALVPDVHAVRLVPPEDEGEAWKVGAGLKAANRRGEQALSMSWSAGEFTGVRVTRGGDEYEGPWRLEALGRDGEYITFSFETREGADAAKQLFERKGIVRLGEDDDGRPMPPSAEQFAEARRMYKETEAALDLGPDEDPR